MQSNDAAAVCVAPPQTAAREIELTIRRIQAGMPLLDGPQKAYAEQLVSSLTALLPVPIESGSTTVPLHERAHVMQQLRQILLPLVRPGEMLIWREPFRWKNKEGVLNNHYECLDIQDLCDGFGYELVHDLTHLAIVRVCQKGFSANKAPVLPTDPSTD